MTATKNAYFRDNGIGTLRRPSFSIDLNTVADRFFRPGGQRTKIRIKEQSKKSVSHYSYGTSGGSSGKSGISSKSEFLESEERSATVCIEKQGTEVTQNHGCQKNSNPHLQAKYVSKHEGLNIVHFSLLLTCTLQKSRLLWQA